MYGVHHRQSPFALLIQLFQLFYNLLNVSVGAAGLVAIKEEFQYNKLLLIILNFQVPLRYEKAGRFEKLLGFAKTHSFVTHGSVRLSCATTAHLLFSILKVVKKNIKKISDDLYTQKFLNS